jgi:hypothetical protein
VGMCRKNNSAQRRKPDTREILTHEGGNVVACMDELQGMEVPQFGKASAKFGEHSFQARFCQDDIRHSTHQCSNERRVSHQ